MTETVKPSQGELKPCPFCGGSDPFVERADFSACYVICNDCGAQGPSRCDENTADSDASDACEVEPGELAAIRSWNTRFEKSLTLDREAVARIAEPAAFQEYTQRCLVGLSPAHRARAEQVVARAYAKADAILSSANREMGK
jgi:Lar family restriction alleviation protein